MKNKSKSVNLLKLNILKLINLLAMVHLISLNSCNLNNKAIKSQEPNWNNLEKMYYFKEIIKGFEKNSINKIIKYNKYDLFDIEKAKNKFKLSKNRGVKQMWKGRTCYAIACFKDGSTLKLELSSNYGVFNIIENNCNYEITDDKLLRSGRWEELIKENKPILTVNKSFKKVNDTTVVFYFNDLSDVYNYKLVDKFYTHKIEHYHDSVVRFINIYSKSDSLIQHINIGLIMHPWYFQDKEKLKISRSYITGKNVKVPVFDQYFGELVIADLNFDGLEDFSTVTDYGADNGSHHSFFIQQKTGLFKLNRYLTEEVTWFPEKFNDSLKTFTTILPAGAWGIGYTTFKYDTISNKWKIIKNYQIDLETGKVVK